MSSRFSALVPTLNEEGSLVESLASLRDAGMDEVLVADGGSQDATVARAQPHADRVLSVTGGLFAQLNHAAAAAVGDVLVFHYADVRFPLPGRALIEHTLADPAVGAGAFRLAFDSKRWGYRFVAAGARVRNWCGLGPFGDQTLFVRAEVFRRLGGFNPGAFLPDLDLVRRLRRAGRFVLLNAPVHASVRRWERQGFARTLLEHWWLTAVYVLRRGAATRAEVTRAEDLTRIR